MRKWTMERAMILYRAIETVFGPHHTWPGDEPADTEAYEALLRKIAKQFQEEGADVGSAKNPDGVQALKMQVEYAITNQTYSDIKAHYPSKAKTWLRNKSAACEAKFISPSKAFA